MKMQFFFLLIPLLLWQCQSSEPPENKAPKELPEKTSDNLKKDKLVESSSGKDVKEVTSIEKIRAQFKQTNDQVKDYEYLEFQEGDSIYTAYYSRKNVDAYLKKLVLKTPTEVVELYYHHDWMATDLCPYFIFHKHLDTADERRHYFFERQLIRFIGVDGQMIEDRNALDSLAYASLFVHQQIRANYNRLKIMKEHPEVVAQKEKIDAFCAAILMNEKQYEIKKEDGDDEEGGGYAKEIFWFDGKKNLVYSVEEAGGDHCYSQETHFYKGEEPVKSIWEGGCWYFIGEQENGAPITQDQNDESIAYQLDEGKHLILTRESINIDLKEVNFNWEIE